MKQIVLFSLMLLLTACDEIAEQRQKEGVTADLNSTLEKRDNKKLEEKDILKKLGFEVNGQKITIDMNQTAEFMKQIEIEMHGKADEIEHKIEKADINFSRDFGFEVDDTHVAIDLNKTKNMLQQINILMKEILLDGNSTHH